jgi:hypothetical protein
MTQKKATVVITEVKALLTADDNFLKPPVKKALQEILESEMD